MGSFGERLRREREMRGISLDQIVATTKIGRRLLLALEDEQFDLLPGGIFNKSYVRAYAKCIGIDEDEAVAQYLEAAHEAPPDARVIAQQHASIYAERPAPRSTSPLVPVLICLVVFIGVIGGWRVYEDHVRERQQRSEAINRAEAPVPAANAVIQTQSGAPTTNDQSNSGQPTRSSQPVATAQSSTAANTGVAQKPPVARVATTESAAPSPSGAQFELTVRPKDRAWVSIKSDGNYVVRGIIKPPDVKIIHASSQIVFYTGNAGALEISFNGKNVPLSGGPNTEQLLVFDSRGVQPQAGTQ